VAADRVVTGRFVAGAGEDRQAGILGEARVGLAELAEQELGAFAGSYYFCVDTVRAQAKVTDRFVFRRHLQIIKAQGAGASLEL
jgi:hypothetical protein